MGNKGIKKRKTTMKNPLLKVIGLAIVLSLILLINEKNKNQELISNGVENIAIVKSYKHVSFLDNEKSKQTISFHQIGLDYQFYGINYSKTLEIDLQDFKNKIGHKLNNGDTIKIKHSMSNPENVIIE
jgi:hypothetical protein